MMQSTSSLTTACPSQNLKRPSLIEETGYLSALKVYDNIKIPSNVSIVLSAQISNGVGDLVHVIQVAQHLLARRKIENFKLFAWLYRSGSVPETAWKAKLAMLSQLGLDGIHCLGREDYEFYIESTSNPCRDWLKTFYRSSLCKLRQAMKAMNCARADRKMRRMLARDPSLCLIDISLQQDWRRENNIDVGHQGFIPAYGHTRNLFSSDVIETLLTGLQSKTISSDVIETLLKGLQSKTISSVNVMETLLTGFQSKTISRDVMKTLLTGLQSKTISSDIMESLLTSLQSKTTSSDVMEIFQTHFQYRTISSVDVMETLLTGLQSKTCGLWIKGDPVFSSKVPIASKKLRIILFGSELSDQQMEKWEVGFAYLRQDQARLTWIELRLSQVADKKNSSLVISPFEDYYIMLNSGEQTRKEEKILLLAKKYGFSHCIIIDQEGREEVLTSSESEKETTPRILRIVQQFVEDEEIPAVVHLSRTGSLGGSGDTSFVHGLLGAFPEFVDVYNPDTNECYLKVAEYLKIHDFPRLALWFSACCSQPSSESLLKLMTDELTKEWRAFCVQALQELDISPWIDRYVNRCVFVSGQNGAKIRNVEKRFLKDCESKSHEEKYFNYSDYSAEIQRLTKERLAENEITPMTKKTNFPLSQGTIIVATALLVAAVACYYLLHK